MDSVLGLLLMHRFLIQHDRPGMILALIVIMFGILVMPLAFLKNFFIAGFTLLAARIVAAPFFPIEQAAVQRLVPAHLRGQVFGARGSLSISGYPLGGATGGLLGLLSPTLRGLIRESKRW